MGRACGTRPTAFTTTDSSRRASRIRSIVGIIPLFAVEVIADEVLYKLHGFRKRMEWFLNHRRDLARQISYLEEEHADGSKHSHRLLAIPSREQLERVLRYVLDENEFLSPHGVRALPRFNADHPHSFWCGDEKHRVEYISGEIDLVAVRRQLELARTRLVSGELSPDRSPRTLPPLLRRFVPNRSPTGSGQWMTLQ